MHSRTARARLLPLLIAGIASMLTACAQPRTTAPREVVYTQATDTFAVIVADPSEQDPHRYLDEVPIFTANAEGITPGLRRGDAQTERPTTDDDEWLAPYTLLHTNGEWTVTRVPTMLAPDTPHAQPVDLTCILTPAKTDGNHPMYKFTSPYFADRKFNYD